MNNIIIIITGILGASLTFYVSKYLKQGAVRASALLSLIVGLFFYSFPESLNIYLTQNIPIVFIGASFVGMVSSNAKGNITQIAFAGLLFSIIYINKNDLFEGYGGALGAMALIAFLTTLSFSVMISKKINFKKVMLGFWRKFNNNK